MKWIRLPKNSTGNTSRFGYAIQVLSSDKKTMISKHAILLILIHI